MKKITLLLTALICTCTFLMAQPVNVTMQVNLNQVDNLYPGGSVWVYMDAGWSEYYDMTDPETDGIYSFTLQKEADSVLTYSFSYQTGADPNSDYVTETVPAECANIDGFRELLVPAADTVLPAFAFGSCSDTPPAMVNITFKVDMSNETVINNDVQVVIKNPWIWTALTDEGNNVWSGTVNVQAGVTYPYTFVNGGQDYWDGEESVPPECNFGTETAPERHVTVANNDTILETVAFGQCGGAIIDKVNVTFRVDMKDETVSANGVQVVIKDPWIWGAMTDMGEGIWEVTVELTTDRTYPYSFVNGAQDYWAGEETIVGVCKDGENNQRIAGISSSDTTLPAFIFGTCAPRTASVFDNEQANAFKAYPNPADDRIVVESAAYEMNSVSIISLDGSLVAKPKIINNHYLAVDLSDITNGVYILVIKGENVQAHKRLVICH